MTTATANKIYTHKCLACEADLDTLLNCFPVMGPTWDIPIGFIHDTCRDKGQELIDKWNSEGEIK